MKLKKGNTTTGMTFNEYQDSAKTTALYPNVGKNLIYPTLGLCGEAGEVSDLVKKMIRDDAGELTAERREKLIRELGDVLWYCAMVATELGVPLADVASINVAKLAARKRDGKLGGEGSDR